MLGGYETYVWNKPRPKTESVGTKVVHKPLTQSSSNQAN